MNNSDERDYDEEQANRDLMEEQDEDLYHPSMIEFEDTWNAEVYDAAQLIVPESYDEIPEWMFG